MRKNQLIMQALTHLQEQLKEYKSMIVNMMTNQFVALALKPDWDLDQEHSSGTTCADAENGEAHLSE